jgi:pilus assembly protein CpaF
MCTIHANSATDALAKLCTLPLLAGRNIDAAFVIPTVASCIDLVVHLTIDRHGARRVDQIAVTSGCVVDGVVEAESVFDRRSGRLAPTDARPQRLDKLRAAGLDPEIVLAGA